MKTKLLFTKSLEIKQKFQEKYKIDLAIGYTDAGYLYHQKGEYDRANDFYNSLRIDL